MMMSKSPREEPHKPSPVMTALVELVQLFPRSVCFHEMCRSLYHARHAETNGDMKTVEKERRNIMRLYEEEDERLKTMREKIKAPLQTLYAADDEEEDLKAVLKAESEAESEAEYVPRPTRTRGLKR